jgi:pimeloyl-ACP methyl ester carboxylesterase
MTMATTGDMRSVLVGPHRLPGSLVCLQNALGLVVFAHGNGSSRLSARSRVVASALHRYRLDTLLFDLLTPDEAQDHQKTLDIPLLTTRLDDALRWARDEFGPTRMGLFGASTGAAAAICAAARLPARVTAIVLRGGRPDLAGAALKQVLAPTLLIVGGLDAEVLRLNREAMRLMPGETRLEVVPGATHLFAEAGAIETVAHLAGSWFESRMRAEPRA